jgi:hypothetical protein
MLAKVPTAPEMAQVAISSRAATGARGRAETRHRPGQLQAEGRRLGVDAVAAADGGRVLCSKARRFSAASTRRAGEQEVGDARAPAAPQGRCRARRTRSCPDARSAPRGRRARPDGQEGDDVVLGLALDLVDAVDVEGSAFSPRWPFAQIALFAALAFGTTPSSANPASVEACASISNQMRKRFCGSQMAKTMAQTEMASWASAAFTSADTDKSTTVTKAELGKFLGG